ncbi:hypothetical protein LguiA_029282 [Lonicera macranthoides]
MGPNPKSTKLLVQQQILTLDDNNPTGIDRISNLPDEILCHILSFLPTKYAVGTSVLSTRWKNLFPFIPKLSLNFDDSLLLHPHKENPNLIPNFVKFMYNVMNRMIITAPRIFSFILKCQRDYEGVRELTGELDEDNDGKYSHLIIWIYLALRKNVRELTVHVENEDRDFIRFPERLFKCLSVMWVTIGGRFFFDVPTMVLLPNIRSMFLDCVMFPNGEAVERLISGCFFIEEFCLERCDFQDLDVLKISSTTLKLLVIINCKWDGKYEVVLDVPNLELFHYQEDAIAYDYTVKNMGCVRKAHIDIGISWDQGLEDGPRYEANAVGLVAVCSNLETLYLSQNSLHAIQWYWGFVRPFSNLTTLKLGLIDDCGWLFLARLLNSMPNLEVLEFTWGFMEYEDFPDFVSHVAKREPQCLSSRLDKVKIEEFTGEEDELSVVEFFLKSAKVLRELEIVSDLSSEELLNISKKVSLFPKCSAACEIVFTSTEERK